MSEFDKLKGDAEKYAQDHPEQVQKGEEAAEKKLGLPGQENPGSSQQDQSSQDQSSQDQSSQDQAGQAGKTSRTPEAAEASSPSPDLPAGRAASREDAEETHALHRCAQPRGPYSYWTYCDGRRTEPGRGGRPAAVPE